MDATKRKPGDARKGGIWLQLSVPAALIISFKLTNYHSKALNDALNGTKHDSFVGVILTNLE